MTLLRHALSTFPSIRHRPKQPATIDLPIRPQLERSPSSMPGHASLSRTPPAHSCRPGHSRSSPRLGPMRCDHDIIHLHEPTPVASHTEIAPESGRSLLDSLASVSIITLLLACLDKAHRMHEQPRLSGQRWTRPTRSATARHPRSTRTVVSIEATMRSIDRGQHHASLGSHQRHAGHAR